MDQIHILWAALLIISAVALVQTSRLQRRRFAARRRTRRAVRGERDAESLLRRAGFAIEARQPTATVRFWVDGEPAEVEVRGDLLARRRGRRFLVEVKTGDRAPRLTHGPTRRQLLEYERAFDVDALVLLDADRGTMVEVAFEAPTPRRAAYSPWLLAAVGAAILALVALAL